MSSNFTIRKNVEHLLPKEMTKINEAFKKIMRRGKNDRLGYHYLAGIHDVPDGKCWHGPKEHQGYPDVALFLPWHRAYIYRFEKALQDEISDVTLPYWDWRTTTNPKIPDVFANENDENGQENPFYKSKIDFPDLGEDRFTERFSGQTFPGVSIPRLPSPQNVDEVVYDPDDSFFEMSERLRGLHNIVHVWTGGIGVWRNGEWNRGDMSVQSFAAFDPIFWFHHCMVDKLWWMWQKRNGVNNIPNEWLNMVLDPFELKVIDVLNIDQLGYDYVEEGSVVGGNWNE